MFRKILWALGVICTLIAAEGLYRFGGLIAAFGGSDSRFYMAFLVISILAAVAFVVAFFRPIPGIAKWLLFAALLISSGLMLMAPSLPVTEQVFVGLAFSALLSLSLPLKKK
jgi:hypothetical protein